MSDERRVLVSGNWRVEDCGLVVVSSSWTPSNDERRLVARRWPGIAGEVYDGGLWRYEGIRASGDELVIDVSRTSYKWHFVLRTEPRGTPGEWPNPLSVTPLIITTDGRLVAGIRRGPDQPDRLHAVGAGFIDPVVVAAEDDPTCWQIVPERPVETAAREIQEETSLVEGVDFERGSFRVLGLVWGDNHDTTCVVLAPVRVGSREVVVSRREHRRAVFIDTDREALLRLAESGYTPAAEGYLATDHFVLAVRLLAERLELGDDLQ